jgi:hypothetical protein
MPLGTHGTWCAIALAVWAVAASARAQETTPPVETRTGTIEQAQAEKAKHLHPFVPGKAEEVLDRVGTILIGGTSHVHPFFDSAYSGGGFSVGAGWAKYVSSYNVLDVRGSLTFS